MAPDADRPRSRRGREVARRLVGLVLGFVITAYGAGAAVSVAVSEAETVGDKASAALGAVSVLQDRYESARYVAEHRDEIQEALAYVSENTPPQRELEAAAAESSRTLDDIATVFEEAGAAREALGDISLRDPTSVVDGVGEALGHAQRAFDARPDAEELRELGERAEQAGPLVGQVRVLSGGYVDDLLHVADNFSSDELPSTLGVMAAALATAFVLAHAVGFWARRGRPGLIARTLQRRGARVYRSWYVEDPQRALGEPLYAVARERVQRDIVADPQAALDPDVLRHLEAWFAGRSTGAR